VSTAREKRLALAPNVRLVPTMHSLLRSLALAGCTLATAGTLPGQADRPAITATIPAQTVDRSRPAGVNLAERFAVTGLDDATAQLVQFDTVLGTFVVLLTPATTGTSNATTIGNFLAYVDARRYDNTFIHRSVPEFVIQGGGFIAEISPAGIPSVPTFPPIPLEYNLPNTRGTLSMARTSDPNSATSQFFVNTVNNTTVLGPGGSSPQGYAVFGRVLAPGLEVIDALAATRVFNAGGVFSEIPLRDYPFPVPNPAPAIQVSNLLTIRTARRATVQPGAGLASVLHYDATSSAPDVVVAGISGRVLSLTAQPDRTGTATVTVRARDAAGNTVEQTVAVTVQAPPVSTLRPINLASRARVGTGGDILINGFFLAGTQPRTLLLRAVGPRLAAPDFNVPGALANPRLTLFRQLPDGSSEKIAENEKWGDAPNAAAIAEAIAAVRAFDLSPGSLDAALLVKLPPGGYTAQASGVNDTTGVALIEAYEVGGPAEGARLVNLSVRALVGTGADVVIPGLVVQGGGPRSFLIRAIGPGLADFGVPGTLADPEMFLERLTATGPVPVIANDNWTEQTGAAAVVAAGASVGAFPLVWGSKDAAVVVTLEEGLYTTRVQGKNGGTGVALVEVYELGTH
jgi:cyclophilin family peptidyl-prolyl cis-trans isomerase